LKTAAAFLHSLGRFLPFVTRRNRPEEVTYLLGKILTCSPRSSATVLHQVLASACAKPRDGEISLIITVHHQTISGGVFPSW
jgi:hypothetical protein